MKQYSDEPIQTTNPTQNMNQQAIMNQKHIHTDLKYYAEIRNKSEN